MLSTCVDVPIYIYNQVKMNSFSLFLQFSTSERPDSVEADVLPPHSATSQRSIQSLRDKCYSSTIKDDTNDSISDKVKF